MAYLNRACALVGAAAVLAFAAPAAQAAPAAPETAAAVGKVLTDSAAAYSAGDFKGFISSYEVSPDTTYISGANVIAGYDAIAKTYGGRFETKNPKDLGQLTLKLLNVRQLGPDYVLAIGRFNVHMADPASKDAAGVFSLVFHKGPAGWRIAADHTS
jgi:uncharacterized protein (TIGR02246 family)